MVAEHAPQATPAAQAVQARDLDLTRLSPTDQERFVSHCTSLREQGFDIALRRDYLEVRHGQRDFETVVHLSSQDDLGERRELFRALRTAFGGRTERWFPWLVQSSPTVSVPYEHLREIIEICQALRRPTAA